MACMFMQPQKFRDAGSSRTSNAMTSIVRRGQQEIRQLERGKREGIIRHPLMSSKNTHHAGGVRVSRTSVMERRNQDECCSMYNCRYGLAYVFGYSRLRSWSVTSPASQPMITSLTIIFVLFSPFVLARYASSFRTPRPSHHDHHSHPFHLRVVDPSYLSSVSPSSQVSTCP